MFSSKANAYKLKLYQLDDSKAGDFGEFLPVYLELPEDETILYIVVTDDFKGHMLFGFENGKFARVPLNVYETKTNRKVLSKAFNDSSKIVYMDLIEETDSFELAIVTNDKKALVFNTDSITLKTTRSTQGITIIKIKTGDYVIEVRPLKSARLKDIDAYRPANVPAVGKKLTETDSKRRQISLFDI